MDEIVVGKDTVRVGLLGHSSLSIEWNGVRIQVDPVSEFARYESLPKADIVLVTHEHYDHLDVAAISAVASPMTEFVMNAGAAAKFGKGRILRNGERLETKGVRIEAVPAYNSTSGRDRFHPKGRDNGYVLTLGSARIYIGGDTEDIPEMADLKDVDVAFLPANQPYTMTPEQLARAAGIVRPRILYPYHLGETDLVHLRSVLSKLDGIDVRVRETMR